MPLALKSSLKLDLVSNPNVLKDHPLYALSLTSTSESSLVLLGDSTSITQSPLVIISKHFIHQAPFQRAIHLYMRYFYSYNLCMSHL